MAGWIVLSLLGLLAVCGVSGDADYYIGAGRYDITGPAAEVEMVRDSGEVGWPSFFVPSFMIYY